MTNYKQLSVYNNKNTFYYVNCSNKGILAWEELNNGHLEPRLLSFDKIKNIEEFLKDIGEYDRYEKFLKELAKIETKINENSLTSGTNQNSIVVKVDNVIKKQEIKQINNTIQTEIKRRRGRPKGSKNKPKADKNE
jgi:hypothetical protein